MAKLIKAVFGAGQMSKTCPQWQYDYNTILQFVGLDLPATFEVDLANSKTGQSTTVIGDADGCCTIPAQYFIPGTSIFAWAYIVDSNSGYTRCQVEIPIHPRAQHTGDPPTPEQQSALDQAIALLNAATENIPNEINAALEAAKKSGEFDGENGDPGDDGNGVWYVDVQYTRTTGAGVQAQLAHMVGRPSAAPAVGDLCVVSDGRFGAVTSLTVRVAVVPVLGDLSGKSAYEIAVEHGYTGTEAEWLDDLQGADGYSPTVTITEITGGHRITITDEAHPDGQSFDVMDGSGGVGTIDSDFSTTSENPVQNKVITAAFNTALQQLQALGLALDDKVNKVSGKGLSTNDFTDSDKAKLDDAATEQWVTQQGYITDAALGVYRTAQAQDVIDQQQNTAIAAKYSKPSGGIPKTDLASAVQTSLGKADTALQSAPVTSVNGQTGAVSLSIPSTASDVGAVAVAQGVAHAGEFCVVGSDGNITTVSMTAWQGGSF